MFLSQNHNVLRKMGIPVVVFDLKNMNHILLGKESNLPRMYRKIPDNQYQGICYYHDLIHNFYKKHIQDKHVVIFHFYHLDN